MTLRIDSDIMAFDPNARSFNYSIMSGWLECLHTGDWPLEPIPFDQKFGHLNYTNCQLAESWEFSEPVLMSSIYAKEYIGKISLP